MSVLGLFALTATPHPLLGSGCWGTTHVGEQHIQALFPKLYLVANGTRVEVRGFSSPSLSGAASLVAFAPSVAPAPTSLGWGTAGSSCCCQSVGHRTLPFVSSALPSPVYPFPRIKVRWFKHTGDFCFPGWTLTHHIWVFLLCLIVNV